MSVAIDSSTKDEITDPVEKLLRSTGCLELHYEVLNCHYEHKDWRKCQDPVKKFKECMDSYNQAKSSHFKSTSPQTSLNNAT